MNTEVFIKTINEKIKAYYELRDLFGRNDDYVRSVYDTIDGMCEAYQLLTGNNIEWSAKGVEIEEV